MTSKREKDAKVKWDFGAKLSREQADALGIRHPPTHLDADGKIIWEHVDGSTSTHPYTTEKAWYRYDHPVSGILLGIVLFDNVDNDWSYVAQSRKPGDTYKAFEVETSFPTQEDATAALQETLERGPKKEKTELLIDQLYRQTFKKHGRNETLRGILESARRFVLDDAMTAFLYELTYTAFHGPRMIDSKNIVRWKKVYERLDETRHFSRLPHAKIWVELSREAALRTIEMIRDRDNVRAEIDIMSSAGEPKRDDWEGSGQRMGWLMQQHPKVETAFMCTQFYNRHKDNPEIEFIPVALSWQTDDDPLPWQLREPQSEYRGLKTGSELITGIHGYARSNVGFQLMVSPNEKLFSKAELEQEYHNAIIDSKGILRYIWMFLSTINKIPLVGQHEVKPSRGFVAKGRYRHFLSHQVITLHVPEKAKRKTITQVLGQLRRRAHMVRGHWRDDWRLPKGNKSLWIAEHQRGDASLGFVTHDYNVEHEERKRA
ncbi:MAG: hypothetical protein C5B60_04120 [Chloroflexi bacterium]|nr:MAG: hypothetical protein C5B60_04120 [Chloroflexota bacterium]